jgi:hypothetical protein
VSAKAKNGYREILDLQNPKTFEAREMLVEMGINTKAAS